MTSEQRWWPSPFGAGDELGMLNHIDDAKRRAAAALVREGRMYDLSQVLDEKSPAFPGRYFRQTLVTTAHHANAAMPLGENQVNWMTEIVSGTMQLGTHLDALSHLQIGDRGYNGWTVAELAGVACFLASDMGAYITGQTIFVDGGLTLFPSFATPWSSE